MEPRNLARPLHEGQEPKIRDFCRGAVAGIAGAPIMHGFRVSWEIVTKNRKRGAI